MKNSCLYPFNSWLAIDIKEITNKLFKNFFIYDIFNKKIRFIVRISGEKMEDKYPKAYKEVIEILKYVPKESVSKIPNSMIQTFEKNMDGNYEFKVDENKSFEEQKILDETKAILAIIFRDYWATPFQREKIIAKEKYEKQKIEKEKKIKYSPDEIFIKKSKNNHKEYEEEILPAVCKEKFYHKLLNFFRKIFNIEE